MASRWGAFVLAGVVLAASAGAFSLGAPRARGQASSPVTPELRRAFAASAPGERVPVLVVLARRDAPPPLAVDHKFRAQEQASNLAAVYGAAAEGLRSELPADLSLDLLAGELVWIGGAIAAEVSEEQLRELERNPRISRIHYDGLIEVDLSARRSYAPPLWAPGLPIPQDPGGGLSWGLIALGAPKLWERGATGRGVVVAIIDSGVDGNHPLLDGKWRGLSGPPGQAWFDPWSLWESPFDDNNLSGVGHGTIVATIAVGSLEPGDTLIEFGGSIRIVEAELEVVTGVAPGAEWVAANAFEEFGGFSYTRRSILLQSLQWVLDPDGDPATLTDIPDVVNNSWGFFTDGCSGMFDRAIDALEAAGVPVVFAAGNRQPGADTVASPADRADLLLNSFAVGSADLVGGEIVVPDNSLGGPSPCVPGAVKPEVVAPGNVPVVRAQSPTTAVVAGRSGAFTSWAAPGATGSIALLKGLNPAASSSDLKGALFGTAVDLDPPGLDNRSGAGFIDLVAAAERVGGLGGVSLEVTVVLWDSAAPALIIELFNGGPEAFPGGMALLRESGGPLLASGSAPAIASRARSLIRFPGVELAERSLTLSIVSDGARLDFVLSSSRTTLTTVQLEDGALTFSLDASGRIGRVAGVPGFGFLDGDWLAGGGLLFGLGDLVSDGAYVDVQSRPSLKTNPIGSDTDWSGESQLSAANRARLQLTDRRALQPLGAQVNETIDLVTIGDTAAYIIIEATLDFSTLAGAPLAGLLLDWDFAGRDSVAWDDAIGASVMTAADSSGPWVALTTAGRSPTTSAAIPLGSVSGGRYVLGSGVLGGRAFPDSEKGRLMRLGGALVSTSAVEDWAQLVSLGPLEPGASVTFLVAVGVTMDAMRAALDSARKATGGLDPDAEPVTTGLQLLPPFPNPFDPTAGGRIKLPFLVGREGGTVQSVLEIYTISGRFVYRENRPITPSETITPFEWDGIDGAGRPAATGVYGYILRVGPESRFGKFVVLK